MADVQGFAFFCEDFRQEAGNKTSYMGVVGPHMTFEAAPESLPADVSFRLAKLVAACMAYVPTDEAETAFHVELLMENAPEGVPSRLEQTQTIPISQKYGRSMAQFNAQLPGFPVQDGMKVTANFTILGHTFSASVAIDFERSQTD